LARLKGSDARISQAYFNSIKHGFLNYLQNTYEKLNLKKNKNTDALLIKRFINNNIEELALTNFRKHSKSLTPNVALRRFTQHFKDLFSKNINVTLKVWEENFKELEPFKENFVLTKELLKVIKARNNFLAELKQIEKSVIDKTQEAAKEEAIKLYQEKQSLKFPHRSPFFKLSEREFARAAELLSLRTMDVTGSRQISVRLDIKGFYSELADLGFYSSKRKSPLSVPKLTFLNDYEIISLYNSLIRGYLKWFRCSDNFTSAKNIIWTLRISCLKTLARKHKKNLKWALTIFTINVEAKSPNGTAFSLPSTHEISQMTTKFLIKDTFQRPDAQNLLKKYSLRLHSNSHLFFKCAVADCFNIDIEIHHVKKLGRRIDRNGKITVLISNNKRLSGISAILSAVNRKQIPLCSRHHLEFEVGKYSPLDVDFFKKTYNVDCSGLNFEGIFLGRQR
jgi:Type II intron maturase